MTNLVNMIRSFMPSFLIETQQKLPPSQKYLQKVAADILFIFMTPKAVDILFIFMTPKASYNKERHQNKKRLT